MTVSTPSSHQPGIFRRTFGCGHPEEFIEARRNDAGDQVHNLVTFEVFEDISRRFGNLPTYLQARCLTCAIVAKEQDDRDPKVRPKRTLGTYQAFYPSAMTTKSGVPSSGFEGLFNRHHHCNHRVAAVQPHERVSEDEHRTHRLDMQAQAVKCAGKWLAVPARRAWNMPIQTEIPGRLAGRLQDMRHLNSFEDTNRSTEPEAVAGEGAIDFKEIRVAISRAHILEDEDEGFRMAAVNTISLSRSKGGRQKDSLKAIAKPDTWDPVANSGSVLLDQATEAQRPQHAAEVDLPGRDSAFRDDLVDRYDSPLDAMSDSCFTNQSFEHPRPAPDMPLAPVSPKKGAFDFVKRRSSTPTKKSTKSEPMSMNFRKLGIDVHSARSIKRTYLDSASPDWACQTSLAIEAGSISMESVSKQSLELMGSKHVPDTMRSLDERRNTYPPSGDRSPATPRYARHSEGAPRALRASVARGGGTLVGMEIASPQKESSRHDSAQVAPAIDLNKSLPTLPQGEDNNGEESVASS